MPNPLIVDRRNNHQPPAGPPAKSNLPDPANPADVRAFAALQEPFRLVGDNVIHIESGNYRFVLPYTGAVGGGLHFR